MTRGLAGYLLLLPLLAGCGTVRQALGVEAPPEPSIAIKSAETRWLLIKNPRLGDVPREPEHVWVGSDKMPVTLTTRLVGTSATIAPPEVDAQAVAAPGG